MTVVETARTSYLGYPLEVTDREISVLHPTTGRVLFHGDYEISTARRFIRGYRRDTPENTKPAASLAKATAGSEREGA